MSEDRSGKPFPNQVICTSHSCFCSLMLFDVYIFEKVLYVIEI